MHCMYSNEGELFKPLPLRHSSWSQNTSSCHGKFPPSSKNLSIHRDWTGVSKRDDLTCIINASRRFIQHEAGRWRRCIAKQINPQTPRQPRSALSRCKNKTVTCLINALTTTWHTTVHLQCLCVHDWVFKTDHTDFCVAAAGDLQTMC